MNKVIKGRIEAIALGAVGIIMVCIGLVGLFALIGAERVLRSAFQFVYMVFILTGGILNLISIKKRFLKRFSCIAYAIATLLTLLVDIFFLKKTSGGTPLIIFALLVSTFIYWMDNEGIRNRVLSPTRNNTDLPFAKPKSKKAEAAPSSSDMDFAAMSGAVVDEPSEPRQPAAQENQKAHIQSLIEEAKFHAAEINNSATVFDFVYSYKEFQRVVKELIRLNEECGIYMYPPPRRELERTELNIEATINDFLSRAIGKIWSFGAQWADDIDFLIHEIESDDFLFHLLKQGNKDRLALLKKEAEERRASNFIHVGSQDHSSTPLSVSAPSTGPQKETISIDLDRIIRDENEWRRQQRGLPPVEYELQLIDSMDGHQFERWCADLLRKNGFINVEVTQGSGDQGVDILAARDGIKYAIQCKCYSSDLGNKPIQEVNTGRLIYHCQIGAVMTNRYFTAGGKEAAEATGVLLWDRDRLKEMLEQAQL